MGIEFNSTVFGQRSNSRTGASDRASQPKAQFWLNVGYYVDEGTDDERFVSLPVGIPLDTMERVSTRSSNIDFAQFQAARNDLLEQFQTLCSDLKPGDQHVIRCEGGLSIQIRRVNDEAAAPAVDETNRFARPKLFAVA